MLDTRRIFPAINLKECNGSWRKTWTVKPTVLTRIPIMTSKCCTDAIGTSLVRDCSLQCVFLYNRIKSFFIIWIIYRTKSMRGKGHRKSFVQETKSGFHFGAWTSPHMNPKQSYIVGINWANLGFLVSNLDLSMLLPIEIWAASRYMYWYGSVD